VATIRRALVDALVRRGVDGEALVPWYFPTIDDYRARLTRRGFEVRTMVLFPRPTPLPTDLLSWLETFGESFTRALPAADRDAYLREMQEALRPSLCDERGSWTADYTRLRFAAFKP
jgi:hypothetical protein